MYRVTYIVAGRPLGLTVRCTQAEALDFAEWMERDLGFVVLTVRGIQ